MFICESFRLLNSNDAFSAADWISFGVFIGFPADFSMDQKISQENLTCSFKLMCRSNSLFC